MPAALDYLYTSTTEVNAVLSSTGTDLRLDDDQGGTVDVTEAAVLSTTIVNEATAEVNDYLFQRYAPIKLNDSWSCRRATSIIAAVWVCQRRGNPVPASLEKEYERVIAKLEQIRDHILDIGGIAERESDQIGVSNVTIDSNYDVKQIRVQRSISDRTPTNSPGPQSWRDVGAFEN